MRKHTAAEMGKSGQIRDTKPNTAFRENCDFFRDMLLKKSRLSQKTGTLVVVTGVWQSEVVGVFLLMFGRPSY